MYTSFKNAKKGDITFYTGNDDSELFESKASKIYVKFRDMIKPNMVPVDNPKLEFMKEIRKVCPRGVAPKIIHDDQVIMGPDTLPDNIQIGVEPLNVERDETGKLHDFPYLGNVKIGKNVQIGNNVTIARGALDDTVIEDNVRIDSNVFIGNGVHIMDGVIICVGVIIGGGVYIGPNVFIGLGAIINPHVSVYEGSVIGSGAVVTKDVHTDDVVAGVPARRL